MFPSFDRICHILLADHFKIVTPTKDILLPQLYIWGAFFAVCCVCVCDNNSKSKKVKYSIHHIQVIVHLTSTSFSQYFYLLSSEDGNFFSIKRKYQMYVKIKTYWISPKRNPKEYNGRSTTKPKWNFQPVFMRTIFEILFIKFSHAWFPVC